MRWAYSNDDGRVSFGFVDNKEAESKYDTYYYLPDFGEQADKACEGTLEFYIVINDPELPGYDDKYATLRQDCKCSDIYLVYLGKAD